MMCLKLAGIKADDLDFVGWGTELMSAGAGTREERKKTYLGQIPLNNRIRNMFADIIEKVGSKRALQQRIYRQKSTDRKPQLWSREV